MGWKDLLLKNKEFIIYPWIGGRSLFTPNRTWRISSKLPEEIGWYRFSTQERKAELEIESDLNPEILINEITGYLVGDRIIPDNIEFVPKLNDVLKHELATEFIRVNLIEPGLDRFARITAGQTYDFGPFFFKRQEFPLGPEDLVLNAFLEQKNNINDILGVSPALMGAFQIETWKRQETEKRRVEAQKQRELEEKRKKIREQLGDGFLRREIAKENFEEAARAALIVGGAEYLDHRLGVKKDEMIVRFRFNRRRFECTCHAKTLQILDAGICLTAHYDDPNFKGGTKGDTWFSLESLPSVIREAQEEGRLVVWRHVD